jgi:hypothetical protein
VDIASGAQNMSAEQVYSIDGWTIRFHRNIHMYSHSLNLSRGNETHAVFCEDSPAGFVGIWPYELEVTAATFQELVAVLRKWANQAGFQYRLYTSAMDYEANDTKI